MQSFAGPRISDSNGLEHHQRKTELPGPVSRPLKSEIEPAPTRRNHPIEDMAGRWQDAALIDFDDSQVRNGCIHALGNEFSSRNISIFSRRLPVGALGSSQQKGRDDVVKPVKRNSEATGDENLQLWPMGAVTRRTGIGEHTLRAWERKFGFPSPVRLESGHRRYPIEQVQRLLMINTALHAGYRAGDVVPLAQTELESLLRSCGALETGVPSGITPEIIETTLETSRRFDRDALAASLSRDSSLLGVGPFLRKRVEPLLREVGESWARGELEIRHEHFFSEVLEDHLRALRAPLEASGSGRPVVLATLPDELHSLGLQIVGLAVAAAGRKVRVLGPHLPVEEILLAADVLDAAAVGLSVSILGASAETTADIVTLRKGLRPETRLWVGGAGAAHTKGLPDGVEVLSTLDDLESALQTI